jgi:hypothetical protein
VIQIPKQQQTTMVVLISVFLLLLLSTLVTLSSSKSPPEVDEQVLLATQIVDWLQARDGGLFNSKQEIRTVGPMMGIFAKERIEKGELLCQVPWDSLIHSKRPGSTEEWSGQTYLSCGTVQNLVDEWNKGDDSELAPYIRYLKSQRTGQIPSAWSNAGRALLSDILGRRKDETQRLAPFGVFWGSEVWYDQCSGSLEHFHQAMLVMQRADEDVMIPVYDLYNHDNEELNTKCERTHGEYHQTWADETIEAGEQIFNSYNLCYQCGSRHDNFGTPGKDEGILRRKWRSYCS